MRPGSGSGSGAFVDRVPGLSDRQIRLVYLITALMFFTMQGMSTVTPLLFSSVICTADGHSDADCFAHAGSVNKSVEDEISAESSSYMKYFETGEYVLQMFVLSAISPLSDRLGRKKLLIGGLVGISIDAMGTALLAHRPELVVALHLVCSAFSGKCALLPFPAKTPVANQLGAAVVVAGTWCLRKCTPSPRTGPTARAARRSSWFWTRLSTSASSPALSPPAVWPTCCGAVRCLLVTAAAAIIDLSDSCRCRAATGSYNTGLRISVASFGLVGLATAALTACWLEESLAVPRPVSTELVAAPVGAAVHTLAEAAGAGASKSRRSACSRYVPSLLTRGLRCRHNS